MGWLWTGYVGRSLAYLGLVVVLTKELGPAGFGHLSLFLAVTLGVSQLAGSWPFLAVPVLSGRGGSIAAAFHPAARVAAIGTAIALVVAVPAVALVGNSGAVTLVSLCVYALALVGLQGAYAVFQTEGRMRSIAATQSAERAVGLVTMLVVLVATGLTVNLAEAMLALTAAATCAVVFSAIERRHHILGLPVHERHALATVMHAVGAMAIASACAYGVAWIDVYTLAAFRSAHEVGLYSLAYQIYTFTIQITSLWIVATLPRHARSTAAGVSMAEQVQASRLRPVAWLWGGAVLAGAAVLCLMIPVVFGSDFKGATEPTMLLLVSTILGLGYFAATSVLVAGGKTAVIAKLGVVAVTINLGLDLILVPTIGINGPAYATLAQTLVSTAAALAVTSGWRDTAALMLAGLPAAAAVGLLAVGPRDPVPLAIAVLVSLASVAIGLRGWLAMRDSAAPLAAQP
jgi:O-antigen/teichoic acid export membrane protein